MIQFFFISHNMIKIPCLPCKIGIPCPADTLHANKFLLVDNGSHRTRLQIVGTDVPVGRLYRCLEGCSTRLQQAIYQVGNEAVTRLGFAQVKAGALLE